MVTLAGFNPFLRSLFYANNSALSRWLAGPYGSARDYNEGDHLVREVLFAVHDYLHCWSAAAIAVLAPRSRFDTGPILRDNLEDFVYCHLLTEAAATAGLDLGDARLVSNDGSLQRDRRAQPRPGHRRRDERERAP